MKQYRYILALVFIVVSFSASFTQNIKVKKGKVLYNKDEVALVDSPYRNHYVFSGLDGTAQFEVKLDGVAQNENNIFHYLIITSSDKEKSTEIPYDVLITSLKVERIIAYLLAVKYNLITEDGIDKEALSRFFEVERESLSTKYASVVAKATEEETSRKERLAEIKKSYKLTINADGNIIYGQGGPYSRLAGKIVYFDCNTFSSTPQACIKVYDLDQILIAQLFLDNGYNNYRVITYDDNQYILNPSRRYVPRDYAFSEEFLIDLIDRNYTLEHQAKVRLEELRKAEADLYKEKIEGAAERSVNIYGLPGKVRDKKGAVYSGEIYIAFQQLDINNTGDVLPQYGPDDYGQEVFIKYYKRGTLRTKSVVADDGVFFNVVDDDKTDYYYAVKTKGEAFKKMQNIGSLKLNNVYFYKLLVEEPGIKLLQDPVELQKYVIKIEGEDKGQMIDNRSNEKLSKPLSKYLSKCKVLSEDIMALDYDLKSEENLIQIIKEYSSCTQ